MRRIRRREKREKRGGEKGKEGEKGKDGESETKKEEEVPPTDPVSVLEREEGYTFKYTLPPQEVPEGEARGNS